MKMLNAETLKNMLLSGANNLYNKYPEIDALNVFPVPDGDTGMNMNLTMSSGAKEIINRNDDNAYTIATLFSKGLLMGARGNSGVITSQIFRGFAISLENKRELNVIDFAEAFVSGSQVAYKAVMRPVEGTILTVIRESSSTLNDRVKPDMTIERAMDILLNEAEASLKRTPDLLPVLKEVGVVDSGGAGLVTILEGMKSALHGVVIEKIGATSMDEKPAVRRNIQSEIEAEDAFGYCTEFIMRLGPTEEKKVFNENRFKSVLESRGNSIVVVRDDDIVKVHIHTLTPGDILSYAQNYGEFVTLKIENMTEQHTKLKQGADQEASNNKSQEEEMPSGPKKDFGMLAISAGVGIDELFKELGVDEIVSGGQTMNPSTEDIVSKVKKINAKTVLIFPNNSNIILAATQAKDVLAGIKEVEIIPSKTIPQGINAVSSFNPDASLTENVEEMTDAISRIKSGSVTNAIKDTSIDGVDIKKDEFMSILDKTIIDCKPDKVDALYRLFDEMIDEDSYLLTLLIGQDVTNEEEEMIRKHIEETYPEIETEIRRGDQPVYFFLLGVE